MPARELSWPPGRFVLCWSVGGVYTGIFSVSKGGVSSRCVGVLARALLGVPPRQTQLVTRGLSCISQWAPTDMFSLFSQHSGRLSPHRSPHISLLHKLHVSNLTFQPLAATCYYLSRCYEGSGLQIQFGNLLLVSNYLYCSTLHVTSLISFTPPYGWRNSNHWLIDQLTLLLH